MVQFVCKITSIGCYMVIRVRNQNESSYLCQQYIVSGKASKKQAKNIVSHGTYTPHYILSLQ